MENIFGTLKLSAMFGKKEMYLPIVIKGPTVPLMPVKGITVDGPDTINGVHTDLGRSQSDDGPQLLMGLVDGSIPSALIALPLYPGVGKGAGEMSIGDSREGGEEGRIDNVSVK